MSGETWASAYQTHCTELGHLLMRAGGLEEVLVEFMFLLWCDRSKEEVIACVREWPLGGLRVNFEREYSQLPHPGLVARLKEIAPRLKRAVELRNEFVHATWTIAVDGNSTRLRRPRKDAPREEILKLSPADILEAADAIESVSDELVELWDATLGTLGPAYFDPEERQ